jgi:hypothetical protein
LRLGTNSNPKIMQIVREYLSADFADYADYNLEKNVYGKD